MGSKPSSSLYRIWNELGVIRNTRFTYADEYLRLEDRDGRSLVLYADLGRLERQLKDISPRDSALVDELVAGVRAFARFNLPVDKAPEVQGFFDKAAWALRLLPIASTFRHWKDVSIGDFAKRFQDPLVKEAIGLVFMPEFPSLFMLMTLASLHTRSAGYPLGGSLPLARTIEQRYMSLGGKIHYGSRVDKILVENNRAVGVRLADGAEHRASYVVSAADAHSTVFDMLDGKYTDRKVRRNFDRLKPFPGLVLVGLGVNRRFDDISPSVSGSIIRLDEPIVVGQNSQEWLHMHVCNHDPSLAPEGKTLVTSLLPCDYEYWAQLHKDSAAYSATKDRIAKEVIRHLDNRFPGLASQVEMVNVATPVTFHRYTLNWKGSFEGWIATPSNWLLHIQKSLPGLENFYMAGQWVEVGGGLPSAAFSGRHVTQIICKRDGKRFVSSTN